jgi:hypothetical protein
VYAGDCFVFKSGADGYHLWVVVSGPFQDPQEVLVVNLTTVRGTPFEDLSCVCEVGDQPWIKQQSYVAFDMAKLYTDAHLDRLVTSRAVTSHRPCSPEFLKRIREGALISPDLENRYLTLLRNQNLV